MNFQDQLLLANAFDIQAANGGNYLFLSSIILRYSYIQGFHLLEEDSVQNTKQ